MAKNNKQLSNVQEVRSKNNPQLTLQQEQRIYELYKKKNINDVEFFDAYKSCKNVVVLGNPLCGKSTVINSLLGHELKSVPHPLTWRGDFLIDLADDPHHESHLKISRDFNPEQKKLTPIQAGGITIWECPGLYKIVGMTKGIEDIDEGVEEMKMRESPRVMQLLKTVNSVKFILVAQYNDLTVSGCRGEQFLATVDRIASIFSDLDIIKKSMLLVINKAPLDRTKPNISYILEMIQDTIKYRDMSDHTKTLMKYLKESPIYIFYKAEKADEEIAELTLELIENLPFCDVSLSIQYPGLSPLNQELALKLLAEDDDRIQEEEAKKQLEQAGVDTKNISNAGFFIKVVDFLYATLSSMSIFSKVGQYAGEILMTFSSLIDINNFKNYFSSNKMEAVSEKDYSPQPMSPEKVKLAKCLVKILNDNEDLSKEFNQKFNECIEQYTQCKNDKEKQSIVKQFSEWIISETNLKNELQDFEAELHISDESHNSSESDLSYDGNGGHKPPNPSDPNQPGEGKQEKALQKEPGDTEGNRELTHLVKLVQIKHDFAKHFKDLRAYNPNISEDNVLIEQAFYDKTLEALAFVVPNPVAEDGGGGNLTSDDKNTADKQQEGNTTEAKTDDKSEGDGYDAGMHLGGEVNNPFDINIIV